MATPNYSYEKRQRELAKKRKTEEKRNRKSNPGRDDGNADASAPAENGQPPQAGTGEPVNAG
ncbi:hypothetical protein [Sphaerotilus sp.]|uniref:hypothetical protein n=1 Tax=Sphaerotilus sp. TaxID=2093942 RepID=UPI0034E1FDD2